MSDLTAAMQAAVQSMDPDRHRRSTPAPPTASGVALVLDEHDLPPIRSAPQPRSFAETLRIEYGPVASGAWVTLREGLTFVALFWVSAVLMAFLLAEQTTAPMVVTIALALHGLLVLARAFTPPGRSLTA